MAIPDLLETGLLPPGRHVATVDEVQATFVEAFSDSTRRQAIFDSWLRHRDSLRYVLSADRQWIDGSFVTSKPEPADIDVVTFVDADEYNALPPWRQALGLSLLLGHNNRDFWQVDSFAVPVVADADSPEYGAYAGQVAYWEHQWSHTRTPGEEKGYLEVAL